MYPHTTVFFFFQFTRDDSAEDAQVVTDVPATNNFFFLPTMHSTQMAFKSEAQSHSR
jgi:hypothetical protein